MKSIALITFLGAPLGIGAVLARDSDFIYVVEKTLWPNSVHKYLAHFDISKYLKNTKKTVLSGDFHEVWKQDCMWSETILKTFPPDKQETDRYTSYYKGGVMGIANKGHKWYRYNGACLPEDLLIWGYGQEEWRADDTNGLLKIPSSTKITLARVVDMSMHKSKDGSGDNVFNRRYQEHNLVVLNLEIPEEHEDEELHKPTLLDGLNKIEGPTFKVEKMAILVHKEQNHLHIAVSESGGVVILPCSNRADRHASGGLTTSW